MNKITKIALTFTLILSLVPAISIAEEEVIFGPDYRPLLFLENFDFFTKLFTKSTVSSESFFNKTEGSIRLREKDSQFEFTSSNLLKPAQVLSDAITMALKDLSHMALAAVSMVGDVVDNIDFVDENLNDNHTQTKEESRKAPEVVGIANVVEMMKETIIGIAPEKKTKEDDIPMTTLPIDKEFSWQVISIGGCASDFHSPGVYAGKSCSNEFSTAYSNLWDTENCKMAWEWKELICK